MQSNGGNLAVTHKETVPGYKKDMWFSKDAITSIIALKNLINKYRVTYDSINHILVLHREDKEKPNMELKTHEYGIHFYNPIDKAVVLINTVSRKKQGFPRKKLTV